MGSSSWTPRWRPRKADRAGVSSASNVAVVMVLVLGHLGGEEQDSGRPWWWRCFGYVILQIMLKTGLGDSGGSVAGVCVDRFFRAKAPRFDADGGDACGYRNPPGGAVVGTFCARAPGENPRPLVLSTAARGVVTLLGASVWSSFPHGFFNVFGGKCWSLYSLFIFDLLCKRVSSLSCIGSAVCGFIYKAGRKPVSREEGFDDRANPKIYALSQCAPDTTADVCRTCLSIIIGQLPVSFRARTGGGIFGVWCNFRYEVYPFFSGQPLLQLPQFVERQPASAPPVTRGGEKTRNRTGQVLAIVMPTVAVILAITVVYFFCWRRKRTEADEFLPSTSDDIQHINSLLLDLATLRVATDDFDESKMLGKGGFGMVYKGVLPDSQEIAVKRLGQTSRQGIGELKSELVLIAKLHHKNLVRLVGVCLEEHEKILVYEYMPNRSLDTILFNVEKKKDLDWGKRFKIVNGIARGLQYLHEDSQLKIVHRDLKASNILLDLDYNPKISDFGLAKIFGGDQSEDVTRRIAGTYGYMAPEYAMRGQYSIKSDVFSFGVLVLEIVTGRRNSGSYNTEQDVDLLNIVWEHWTRGNAVELIDPSLSNHPPVDQILKCIHVGLLCVQRKPASRPTMSSVNIMFSSHTVRLPSLSRPAFCIQEVSVNESSTAYSEAYPLTDNSTVMSSNQVSITELSPR